MNDKPNQDELLKTLKDQLKQIESTLSLIGQSNYITRAKRAEQWASETRDEIRELHRNIFDLERENKRLMMMLESLEQYLDIKPHVPYETSDAEWDDIFGNRYVDYGE